MAFPLFVPEYEEDAKIAVACPVCGAAALDITVRIGLQSASCRQCGRAVNVLVTREICGWSVMTRVVAGEGPP